MEEYDGVHMLAMVVRSGNKLVVIHNDWDMPATIIPGGFRATRAANTPGKGLIIETLEAFIDSAGRYYGWC